MLMIAIKKTTVKSVLSISLGFIAASCSVMPKPIGNDEVQARVASDNRKIYANQEPVASKLTLNDAIARAVKYNLDYKTRLIEQAASMMGYRAAFSEIFPNYNVNAHRVKRNNYYIQISPNRQGEATSQDRNRNIYDLDLSWNILDLGVSYYESKIKADEYYITKAKQSQMLSRLATDIRKYYWEAYAHEMVSREIDDIKNEINEAVNLSDKAVKNKVTDIQQALRYQRTILDKFKDLVNTSVALAESKYKLYALMNLPLDAKFYFKINNKFNNNILPKNLPKKLNVLEEYSLYNRTELREEDYKSRISLNEVYKARARMLPGIEFKYTDNYDSNTYILNNKWHEVSYGLTWNIVKLIANYQRSMEMQDRRKLAEMQRLALAAAVISQVGIAKANFYEISRGFNIKNRLYLTNQELEDVEIKKYKANLTHKLNLIEAKIYALESKSRMYLSFSNLQASAGELLYSIGYNPVKNIDIDNLPVKEIATKISENLDTFQPDIMDKGIS